MAKRIVTSGIATGKALPLNAERLSFLQDNVEENINSIIRGLLGSYTTGNVIILYGCVFTGTDPGARTMTAGAIYYNGLVYQVDAASFTTTGEQIPVWTIVVTQDSSDPALMSDGTNQNVSNISKFVLVAGPVGGSGVTGYVCDYNPSNATYYSLNFTRTDRQIDSQTGLSTSQPTGYPGANTISTLTTSAGINRDYKLEFTWSYNRITTSPEIYMGFYKNGTLLMEYHHVPIPTDGQTQVSTIHWLDKNVPPGTVYEVQVRNGVDSNQYNLQSYAFTIDGQI